MARKKSARPKKRKSKKIKRASLFVKHMLLLDVEIERKLTNLTKEISGNAGDEQVFNNLIQSAYHVITSGYIPKEKCPICGPNCKFQGGKTSFRERVSVTFVEAGGEEVSSEQFEIQVKPLCRRMPDREGRRGNMPSLRSN